MLNKIQWPVDVAESKYSRWYNSLIQTALGREVPIGYVERHHIIPRSFGGDDSKTNLVKLTAREHYIAHALLWKMKFPGMYGAKMSYAFNTFIRRVHNTDDHEYKINSKIYETFKKHYSKLMSQAQSGEGNHFYGKKHSEESRRLIGEKSKLKEFKRGSEHHSWGKKQSAEQRLVKSQKSKEKWQDPQWKQAQLDKKKAFFQTEKGKEQAKAFGDKNRGVKLAPERVEKSASKRRGKKAHEIFSPEALINIAEGRKHRVISPEAKAKWTEIAREQGSKPKSESFKKMVSERMTGIKRQTKVCEFCGIECVVSNYNRWHGTKCKHK